MRPEKPALERAAGFVFSEYLKDTLSIITPSNSAPIKQAERPADTRVYLQGSELLGELLAVMVNA